MNIFQRLFGKKKKVQETRNPETFEVYDSIDKRRRSQDDSYNTHYYGTATQLESPGAGTLQVIQTVEVAMVVMVAATKQQPNKNWVSPLKNVLHFKRIWNKKFKDYGDALRQVRISFLKFDICI